MWLIDPRFADYWFPKTSKIVVDVKLHPGHPGVVSFIVDPAWPNRWRQEPWLADIKALAKAGMEGRHGVRWSTVIMIGTEKIPIVREKAIRRAAGSDPSPPGDAPATADSHNPTRSEP
jgi:hypothetical protein